MLQPDWTPAQGAASQKLQVLKRPAGAAHPSLGAFSHKEIGLRNNNRKSPARPMLVNLTPEAANWRFLESQWPVGSALESFTPFFH